MLQAIPKKLLLTIGAAAGLSAMMVSAQTTATRSSLVPDATASKAVIDKYCITCHNDRLKTGSLSLEKFDFAKLGDHAELAEKIVRKLRAGMMPPTNMPRPDAATREALLGWMEGELDKAAKTHLPPPGLHRLNRAEYANVIRDLLALQVDTSKFLPSDDSTHGFDNMAGTLTVSPALIEAYLSAAGKISRLAVGNVTAPTQAVYDAPTDVVQTVHVEGLPFNTRGGMLVTHQFPANAEYVIKVSPIAGYFKNVLGGITGEQLEVTVDGERVKLFDWDKEIGTGGVGKIGETPKIPIRAGVHTVAVAFLSTNDAPGQEINKAFVRTMNSPGQISGYLFYPHVGQVQIEGPYAPTGAEESPSRKKIFSCYPTSAADEDRCARQIVSTLARRAFRRPTKTADMNMLMEFFKAGKAEGGFDGGIEAALQRILADTSFIYRQENEAASLRPGSIYTISDIELASRLSFFLWSSMPDDELLNVAEQGRLKTPAVLEQQVRRMIADPRSQALVENFTGQWLNVRGMAAVEPAVNLFPDFDNTLRDSFRREISLFFDSIIREDRSVLDLLTADYTFVNERLAKHYGIPNVYGSNFRRVTLGPDFEMRRGLLGKGALLTVTSQAARTSPVARGKWFLQTFLGVSPPDPPPNVDTTIKEPPPDPTGKKKEPTMRQIMEQHHSNPSCNTCHQIFEPLGIGMENYDATGMWRTEEFGEKIDVTGKFVDGSPINGPASLRAILMNHSDQFVRSTAEKLLTYALGRGVEYEDMPLVRKMVKDSAANNYRFSSLVTAIVTSPPFQKNMKPAADVKTAAVK